MSPQYMSRFTLILLTALALTSALVLLMAGTPTPAAAAGVPDWQQMHGNRPMTQTMPMLHGNRPMTHTMPTTATTPPGMNRHMQQGQGMMGNMPMHSADTGEQMVMMGRRMQRMGMMMQMMGHMHAMMDQMHGMMGDDMDMMQGMMQDTMPMTRPMGMMDMGPMHAMMGQMMNMMAEMQQMHKMMGMMHGPMAHGMNQVPLTDTLPLSPTMFVSPTMSMVLPPGPLTVQAGAVMIKVTPLNLADANADTIDFAVEFNSHSQPIDPNLAQTATLVIGEVTVSPIVWETASPSGHHVRGVLRFPQRAVDGTPVLAGATEVSLVLSGLPDQSEQTLIWRINPQ